MTTYSYRLDLNDREVIAVEEALLTYLELCKKGHANRVGAKCTPAPSAIEHVLWRLHSSPTMTSTSSFCWPDKSTDN
jgi:hypothetical protein